MAKERRKEIVKDLIEDGRLSEFRDIFLYVPMTDISQKMGVNYGRFRGLVVNPKPMRYSETIALAKILGVDARAISALIHNQLEPAGKKK